MAINNYSVLKGRPIDRRLATNANAHYQVHVVDDQADYRIAINVLSSVVERAHPELSLVEFVVVTDFHHPILPELGQLPVGMTKLNSRPDSVALDFIRGNLFDRRLMKPLAFNIPGPNNDLNEQLDYYISQAINDEEALVYAFGDRWGPETKKDRIFGFQPGNGIHDIHMNQGNDAEYKSDDGVWQDGALLLHFPSESRWVGIFLKFQSQAWHTDDRTGHTVKIEPGQIETETVIHAEPDLVVRIVGAMVNPVGQAPEHETVTLLNTSSQPVNLKGWAIANKLKQKHMLNRQIGPGSALVVALPATVPLSNQGGIITLLNKQGLKVHGVSYTQAQASREGWTIIF